MRRSQNSIDPRQGKRVGTLTHSDPAHHTAKPQRVGSDSVGAIISQVLVLLKAGGRGRAPTARPGRLEQAQLPRLPQAVQRAGLPEQVQHGPGEPAALAKVVH